MFVYQSRRENHTGKNTREAQAIVGRVLGKPIPSFAEIHHVNGNPGDNSPSNLVICEDASYHKILHDRTKALLEYGHAEWKRCYLCNLYDDTRNMSPHDKKGFYHKNCMALHARMYRTLKKKGVSYSDTLKLFRACLNYLEQESN